MGQSLKTIANPVLAEIRDIWYWDPSVGFYNPMLTEPPTIPIGSEAGAQFNVYNLSDEYLDLGLIIGLWDPLGNSLGASIAGPVPVPPGSSFGGHYRAVAGLPGTYTCTVDIITGLYPYEVIGTLENVPVAYVAGELPPLAGHLEEPRVIDITTGETFSRLSLPVQIDGGHEVVVGIRWENEGSETAIFTPTFELVDPDGISREIQTFNTELSPGEGTGGQTGRSVELDKLGMWKIHATLEAEGILLDEETWDAITVTTLPPSEYAGTISKKQLTYDSTVGSIPVSATVPIGTSGIVTVLGRNDMTTAQRMGIEWTVRDPDGEIVEHYGPEWEMWPYCPPGDEHKFDGGRFDIDKLGTYTLEVDLLMNRANPIVVDRYQGDLCTTTTEIPPEYNLIQHTIYPYAYIYDGDVEVTTATFKTDPFTPSAWMGDKFASKLEEEVRARGGRPIGVKAYVDTSPLLWTNFRIEVISTPIGGVTEAAPGIAGIPLWAAILIIALSIIAVIVVATLAITTIIDRFKHQPGLSDVKPSWGKETLILAIRDSEEYWERTLTPVETLEGMSEAELREYLDTIAEEEVPPPEVSWLPFAIIGAAGILGIGALALTTRRKE